MTTHNTNANNQTNLFTRSFSINWEVALYITIFLLAIFTRFYMLGDRAMSHDESLHTRYSWNLSEEGNFQHTPLMHGPILFHATAFFYTLFGDNDFTSRIYTSLLSVLLVMSPLLFRRWLGRWGTILASLMFLISPLILYYGRYIRHDTPSILAAIVMMWAILMYLSGPDNQRRRSHWLYIIAASMVWNLGSKETAFIYIAIFGIFLAIYFFVRLFQYLTDTPMKPFYYISMIGVFLGGVMSLGMYIILDIVQFDMFSGGAQAFAQLAAYDQAWFFIWTAIAISVVIAIALGTLFWVYRDRPSRIPWRDVVALLGVALVICFLLVAFEEVSHTTPTSTEPAVPSVPGADGDVVENPSTITWAPMILVWGGAIASFVFLFFTRRTGDNDEEKDKHGRGFWGTLDLFPEADLLIVIGTLILPWATAFVPYLMGGTSTDHAMIASSIPFVQDVIAAYIPGVATEAQIGVFLLNFWVWLPLMALSITIGLMWDWKRWLIASAIFHAIFAFFFTTVFTNIAGLATGMIYSLGYWLEQQGVRRGSQPQYYYMLIIMPLYEFLPVIGGVLSMVAGMIFFWRKRRDTHETGDQLRHVTRLEAQFDELQASDESDPEAIDDLRARLDHQPSAGQLALQHDANTRLTEVPFLIFFAWLAIFNLVGYSLAGEKMPWLGTHLTTPLIILTAWFFGRIIDKIEWRKFREHGWLTSAILITAFVGLARVIGPLLLGPVPFASTTTANLADTYEWLAALLITVGAFTAVFYLVRVVGWRHIRQMIAVSVFILLATITLRAAWMASFINQDYATEFLVYAHAAPGVKWVLEDIEELSLQMTDGYDLALAYDNEVSWPYSWYFRNFENVTYVGENPTVQNLEDAVVVVVGAANLGKVEPILEDRYIRYDHNRLWWPMQDYFYLNASRVNNALSLNPANEQASQIRRGIFDIWWSRDYTTYGLATNKDFDVENWPVSDRMHFYMRKDFAAETWSYGVGEGGVVNPLNDIEVNQCTANWQSYPALLALEAPDGLTNPLGLAIDPDGNLHVAEEFGHQISVFDDQDRFVRAYGTQGNSLTDEMPQFERPNGLAFSSAGTLYVADTWNHRIQSFNDVFQLQTVWGQYGAFSFDAPEIPTDGFWGPRDVAVDAEGRIFVSDTGNKRVRVYQISSDGSAQHIYDIGAGGSALGELDEPSGLAVADGLLYVADTWNRRVSVFSTGGAFVDTFRVRGWYEDLGNRPYVAVDADRGLLYVTDPDAGRVLVYTTAGDCVGSFGQAAGTTPTLGQFDVAAGIAVDDQGFVYVTDSQLGRVLKFQPFPYDPATAPEADASLDADDSEQVQDENGGDAPSE